MTFFQLGHHRTHQAVADKLGEGLPTVKNWSSKFNWNDRVQAFNSGLLQQQAQSEAARRRQRAADWTARLDHFREQEWDAAQKLLAAARCFLESFGEEDLHNMSLAQVSRALKVSSTIGRLALAGAELSDPPEAPLAPVQQQLLQAVSRVYGQVSADRNPSLSPVPAAPPIATNSTGFQSEPPPTEVGPPCQGGRGEKAPSLSGTSFGQSL